MDVGVHVDNYVNNGKFGGGERSNYAAKQARPAVERIYEANVKRLIEKGMTKEDAEKKMRRQMLEEKAKQW